MPYGGVIEHSAIIRYLFSAHPTSFNSFSFSHYSFLARSSCLSIPVFSLLLAVRMATIRIAETALPLRHPRSDGDAVSSAIGDGVYNMRAISRVSSWDAGHRSVKDIEAEDDDPGLRQSTDFKSKQVWREFKEKLYWIQRLICISGFPWQAPAVLGIPVHRCYLWRYRHQSALRVFLNIQRTT